MARAGGAQFFFPRGPWGPNFIPQGPRGYFLPRGGSEVKMHPCSGGPGAPRAPLIWTPCPLQPLRVIIQTALHLLILAESAALRRVSRLSEA